MDEQRKNEFIEGFMKYFPGAELPIAFYYTDDPADIEMCRQPDGWQCFIGELGKIRNGKSLAFNVDSLGCAGAKRYLGFTQELMPGFEYFLSHGIPGKIEGERYKKSPELVKELLSNHPKFEAPGAYIVFKRFDKLDETDEPEVIVFCATPDVLSGLFTLAGFDEAENESVITPFCAGCGSIVLWPYQELKKDNPRAVLGMFDVSARPSVPENTLTFAIPRQRFERMLSNAPESFLITESWKKVMERMSK